MKTIDPGETALDNNSAGRLKRGTLVVSMLKQKHTVNPHHPIYTNILSDTTNNTQKRKGESWPCTRRKALGIAKTVGGPLNTMETS